MPNDCDGSIKSWLQNYRNVVDRGGKPAFGSDLNGFVTTIGPRWGAFACPAAPDSDRPSQTGAQGGFPNAVGAPPSWNRYTTRGMADIGTEAALVYDMTLLGVDTAPINSSAQAFMNMWKRAYDDGRRPVG